MSDFDDTTPLPPPPRQPPPPPHPRPDVDSRAQTSNRGPIILAVSLLLLAVGIAAAVTGTLANSAAQDDRDTTTRELQVSRDELARAETALANSQDEVESAQASARATLELALQSVNPAARLLAINERQLEIFREQRDVSLAPGRGVTRFNELIAEANALADEYNALTDQLTGL